MFPPINFTVASYQQISPLSDIWNNHTEKFARATSCSLYRLINHCLQTSTKSDTIECYYHLISVLNIHHNFYFSYIFSMSLPAFPATDYQSRSHSKLFTFSIFSKIKSSHVWFFSTHNVQKKLVPRSPPNLREQTSPITRTSSEQVIELTCYFVNDLTFFFFCRKNRGVLTLNFVNSREHWSLLQLHYLFDFWRILSFWPLKWHYNGAAKKRFEKLSKTPSRAFYTFLSFGAVLSTAVFLLPRRKTEYHRKLCHAVKILTLCGPGSAIRAPKTKWCQDGTQPGIGGDL